MTTQSVDSHAARTARRLGATEALIVYRRDRAHMPALDFEADEALEEGIKIKWLTTIKEIVGPELTVEMMALDDSGKPRPTGQFENDVFGQNASALARRALAHRPDVHARAVLGVSHAQPEPRRAAVSSGHLLQPRQVEADDGFLFGRMR